MINANHHLWILLIRIANQPGLFKRATLTLIPECYLEIKDNLWVQELPRQCLIQPASWPDSPLSWFCTMIAVCPDYILLLDVLIFYLSLYLYNVFMYYLNCKQLIIHLYNAWVLLQVCYQCCLIMLLYSFRSSLDSVFQLIVFILHLSCFQGKSCITTEIKVACTALYSSQWPYEL